MPQMHALFGDAALSACNNLESLINQEHSQVADTVGQSFHMLLDQGRVSPSQLKRTRASIASLQCAIQSGCVSGMEVALEASARAGVDVHALRKRLREIEKLACAVQCGELAKLFSVCADAERAGVGRNLIEFVRVYSEQLCAVASLTTALHGDDVEQISLRIREACDAGVLDESRGYKQFRFMRASLARLQAAEHAGDPWGMKKACDLVEQAGFAGGRVAKVRRKIHRIRILPQLLCASIATSDLDVIEEAYITARVAGVSANALVVAWQDERRKRALHALHASRHDTPADAFNLLQLCDEAEAVCDLDHPDVLSARMKARQLQAKAELQSALDRGSAEDIEWACDVAACVGFKDSELITTAKQKARLIRTTQRLELALQGEDMNALSLACATAEKVQLSMPLPLEIDKLASAKKRLAVKTAERKLAQAIEKGNVLMIQFECDSVERNCLAIEPSLLDAARQKTQSMLSERTGHQCTKAQLETALLVGTTPNHNRLAYLLAQVLSSHNMMGALPQLLSRLSEHRTLIDGRNSRAYSLCDSGGYPVRGERPYFKPKGWLRYSLHIEDFGKYHDWCVAYHGTTCENMPSILLSGLRRPGEQGISISHGQAYSSTQRTIYVSPSIEYAAHPVYSKFFTFRDQDHWGQVVFQCRVRPGSFAERPGTLGNKHWPPNVRFDPNFANMEGLEWLLENPEDVVVYGFMVREFGQCADASLHGELVRKVSQGVDGPEFEWTRLRAQELQHQGLFVTP